MSYALLAEGSDQMVELDDVVGPERLSARANQLEGLSLQKDGSLMSRKRGGASNSIRFSSYWAMAKNP